MGFPYKVRQRLKRIYQNGEWTYRRLDHTLRLTDHPPILCNSFQKSGTHLLAGLISQLPDVRYYRRKAYWHFLNRSAVGGGVHNKISDVTQRLDRCLPGEMYRGHIAAHPQIAATLKAHQFKHIFIFRDLRDVLVSLMFWWLKRPEAFDNWPYRHYVTLTDNEERLKFLITGFAEDIMLGGKPAQTIFPDIGARFREFMPWLNEPNCLPVRFEDLIDPDRKNDVYEDLARYLVPQADGSEVANIVTRMEKGSDPGKSKTFRKGRSGEWQKHFTAEHKALFKQYAGDILIQLGYEKDLEW